MGRFFQIEIFEMVIAPLTFILLLVTFLVAVLVVFKCRTKGDAARQCFTWLKVAIGLHCVHLLVDMLLNVLDVIYFEVSRSSMLLEALLYMEPLGMFFKYLVLIFLFLCLSSLASAMHGLSSGESAKAKLPVVVGIRILALLLAILSITYLGLGLDNVKRRDITMLMHSRRVSNIIEIFLFLVSLVVVAAAIKVQISVAKLHPRLKKLCMTLLICSLLWVVRNIFHIIWIGLYLSFTNVTSRRSEPAAIIILHFVFNDTILFVIFFLLLLLGRKKVFGLWSTPDLSEPHRGQAHLAGGGSQWVYGNGTGQQFQASAAWTQQPTVYSQPPQHSASVAPQQLNGTPPQEMNNSTTIHEAPPGQHPEKLA